MRRGVVYYKGWVWIGYIIGEIPCLVYRNTSALKLVINVFDLIHSGILLISSYTHFKIAIL